MIEIISRENQQEEQEINLPKNIRQVGSPGGRHRIYMEDYVYTYLRSGAKEEKKSAAVLFGKSYVNKDMRYTFIQGAVGCGQAVFQFDNIDLDESFWEYICREARDYFPDTMIVGWFIGEQGGELDFSPAIESAHRKYFAGRDKVLMLMDAEEDEEVFYVYEQGYLQKREGYYIYYEKNIAMQEYMVWKREAEYQPELDLAEEETRVPEIFVKSSLEEPVSEAEKALQSYRHIMQEKRGTKVERQNKRILYGAASFFMIALCIVGITTINNYQKMKKVEDVLYVMKKEEAEKTKSDLVVKSVSAQVTPLEEEQGQSEEPQPTMLQENTEVQQPETPQQNPEVQQPAIPQENAEVPQPATPQQNPEVQQPAIPQENTEVPQPATPQYYTVQAGDTLESICLKIYQDKSMVAALCQANGIENGNQIQAGQELVLP